MERQCNDVELRNLWRRLKDDAELAARERLVLAYRPLVEYVARRAASGLPAYVNEADLVSSGILGLMSAIERFDAGRNIKFETFAIMRIKGAIIDQLRDEDWVPRSLRSKAREIERAGNTLAQQLQRTPTDAEIAEYLGVSPDDFDHVTERISNSCVVSLDERCTVPDTSGDPLPLIDTIQDVNALDPSEAVDAAELRDRLADAIGQLPERERIVLALYHYEDLTLREIGEVIGVTESRVSQMRKKAMLQLKARLDAKPFVDGERRPVRARRRGPHPLPRVNGVSGRRVPVGSRSS